MKYLLGIVSLCVKTLLLRGVRNKIQWLDQVLKQNLKLWLLIFYNLLGMKLVLEGLKVQCDNPMNMFYDTKSAIKTLVIILFSMTR